MGWILERGSPETGAWTPEAAYDGGVVRRLVPGPGGCLRRRGLDVVV
jgi:hypothetical protein